MIPRRRHFSDISQGSIISHTEHRKRHKNVHFDQMIRSMSAVNTDRRQRKPPSNAYSSSSELSFMKRTDTPSLRRSSSASKVSSESSSSHHTCNPLPQWLVNTLKTLSKKNPLRLMLPPASTSESSSVLHTQTEITIQPRETSATGPVFAFNLPEEPNKVEAQRLEHLIALPQTTLITDDDWESWPEPLPFSTPGPGSLLGSSVASDTTFSLPIPKKHLPLVSYLDKTHIGSDLPSKRSHSPDSLSYEPYGFETFTYKVGSSWNPSMPEENCQSLFSNIYSTPGPRYCGPQPIHFDSPLEDPLSSDPLEPGYEMDDDAIDFEWKPFDRKNLVAPDRVQKPIYGSGPVCPNDASEYDVVEPVDTRTNTLSPYTSPSPLLPISPIPFRFLLPPESDAPTPVPECQAQDIVQKPSTPKKSPYFALPGVYISPLDENQSVHDTATVKKHGSELYPVVHRDNAGNGVEQVISQSSSDSIKPWEENL